MSPDSNASAQSRSGIKHLRTGEILFNDGDVADSLYIIQKGQIRLFKPKGKGYTEVGVLRTGEVIGEMAFFDEDGSGNKRSCSAAAITPVEIIEISFAAFGKTMQNLNPWFKTIINTLASRLRKTNIRVRELEDNQASVSYSGKLTSYEFLKPLDVMRIMGTLFLVFKAHGELKGHSLVLSKKTLQLYATDMYQIIESKLEEILATLSQLGWLEIENDNDGLPSILSLNNIEYLRQIFIFFNSERRLDEAKRMRISDKCEMLIAKIIEHNIKFLSDIPNLRITEDFKPRFTQRYQMTSILDEFKMKNISVTSAHLDDGKNIGLFGETSVADGQVYVEIDLVKVQKMYPTIRFINAIRRSNKEKSHD
jgi:CRP/FNR family cyclic AMP-dependent transcriptional regulator